MMLRRCLRSTFIVQAIVSMTVIGIAATMRLSFSFGRENGAATTINADKFRSRINRFGVFGLDVRCRVIAHSTIPHCHWQWVANFSLNRWSMHSARTHTHHRTHPSPLDTGSAINNSKIDIYAYACIVSLGRSRQTCNLRQVPACVRLHRNGNSRTQHSNTKMLFLTVNLFRLFFFFFNFASSQLLHDHRRSRNLHGKEYITCSRPKNRIWFFTRFRLARINVSDEWLTCI